MSILAILALVIISAASGRVWFTLLATPEKLDALEAWGASVALGVAFNGWLGLLLAEIGFFSMWWIGLVNVAIILIGLGRYRQALWNTDLPIPRLEAAVLAVWLLVAVVLFFRPHQFLTGGADAGVYVNLAAQIAHSGTITMHDETLALIDPALYPALLRPQPEWFADPYYWLPAFNVPDQSGTIVPRFYHLAPVWQAAGYQLGGLEGLLYLTPLWALLGSSVIYLTMRRLWSWPWAAVGLWGLTLNALQVWFARYPTT
ncbi:MAG: hypothetical protein KDE51_08360, partial [Anaerolineales bacterium]|nr:hypothetical protein [Anaerolineales bacterium]